MNLYCNMLYWAIQFYTFQQHMLNWASPFTNPTVQVQNFTRDHRCGSEFSPKLDFS
jgi:hypothetical protein